MSAKGHYRPTCAAAHHALFDHPVGALQDGGRNLKTQCLGRLQVEGQVEAGWAFDREFGELGAFEDAVGESCDAAERFVQIRSIGDQPAVLDQHPLMFK